MHIFQSKQPLIWGEIDLPYSALSKDWFGKELSPPLNFVLACDSSSLWFLASRSTPFHAWPSSRSGEFIEGLWQGDVVELFLANPETGHYLEWNLAPHGAWWAAYFLAPRLRVATQPDFPAVARSYADKTNESGWCAALQISLNFLRREMDFSPTSIGNVTGILNSPQQSFFSASPLSGASPDFHQPQEFSRFHFHEL